MRRKKLAIGLAALAANFGGLSYLAAPARAEAMKLCSPVQLTYAVGYADGYCGGQGAGTVTSCTDNGDGTFYFTFTC